MDQSFTFHFQQDGEVINKLRSYYTEIIPDIELLRDVAIVLPSTSWMSANSLSHILIFIQAIKGQNKFIDISVDLFDLNAIGKILSANAENVFLTKVKDKVVFYETMEFIDRLSELDVTVFPTTPIYAKIKSKLSAKKEQLKNKYSSRILSLSPLIDNQVEQHELSRRMNTLSNILYYNLPNVNNYENIEVSRKTINVESIKKFSTKIMYELVKNIYQHAGIEDSNSIYSSGFACAQIYPYSKIKHNNIEKDLLGSIISYIRKQPQEDGFNYLAISINDWGVGIIERVLSAIEVNIDKSVRNRKIDKGELLKIAAMSDFTSRLKVVKDSDFETMGNIDSKDYFNSLRQIIDDEKREFWIDEKGNRIPLEPKGYGLVYCLGFIFLTVGAIRIRCGEHELYITPKISEYNEDESDWKSSWKTAQLIKKNLNKYFNYKVVKIPASQKLFPGTQILIEVPVKRKYFQDY